MGGVISVVSACGGGIKQSLVCDGTEDHWAEVGYKTALKGKSVRTFDTFKAACGSTLGKPQQTAFVKGYTKGIFEFCTFNNGYELGLESIEKPTSCPLEIRAEFDKGYLRGAAVLRERLAKLHRQQDDNENRLRGGGMDESVRSPNSPEH
jgi:Protein of unknown function (DUF2799).